MKLMTLQQYMKMSKPALVRKIMKTLRAMPKKRLAMVCYNITKAKLPRLRQRQLTSRPNPIIMRVQEARQEVKRKTKRKFSRKQLAAQRLFAKRARAGTLRKRRRR